jgi:hypothetical protein
MREKLTLRKQRTHKVNSLFHTKLRNRLAEQRVDLLVSARLVVAEARLPQLCVKNDTLFDYLTTLTPEEQERVLKYTAMEEAAASGSEDILNFSGLAQEEEIAADDAAGYDEAASARPRGASDLSSEEEEEEKAMEEEAAPTTRRRMPSARMAAYLSGQH